MLHRVLFVVGMTVGVVAPIVWGAYTSRQPITVTVQRVAAREPAQPPRATVVPPATTVSPAASLAQKTPIAPPAPSHAPAAPIGLPTVSHAPPMPAPAPIKLALSSPLPTTIQAPHAEAPAARISEEPASRALARAPLPKERPRDGANHMRPAHKHDGGPTVVSRYVGPHIIVVCAELTARERQHAGCR